MAQAKYKLRCMNAFIDGAVINDFDSEAEAIQYAANYEARLYRLAEDGGEILIYWPGMNEEQQAAEAGQ